jgi:hypothetical protein
MLLVFSPRGRCRASRGLPRCARARSVRLWKSEVCSDSARSFCSAGLPVCQNANALPRALKTALSCQVYKVAAAGVQKSGLPSLVGLASGHGCPYQRQV